MGGYQRPPRRRGDFARILRTHRDAWITLAYFTPSGRSIQAKGISPDIEVLQDVPEELKARTDTRGEASLRGHLKAEGDEQTGSQSYIPPDPNDDKALHTALDLIRGIQKNSAYPPNPKTAVPN
jgi:carboxyl-terminal processing protease